mgnify:CR=1
IILLIWPVDRIDEAIGGLQSVDGLHHPIGQSGNKGNRQVRMPRFAFARHWPDW